MHTIYCWNNLFYYNVQLKLSTFFHWPPIFRWQSVWKPTQNVKKCTKKSLELCINSKITLLFPPYVSAHGLHQWKWYMYWRYNKQWCCDVITAPKWRNSHGVVGMSCNAQNILGSEMNFHFIRYL